MIKYLDYYVPEERISVATVFNAIDEEKIPAFFETRADGIAFFKSVLNLKEVADAGQKTELDLFDILMAKNLKEQTITPLKTDLIIVIDDALKRGARMDNFGQYVQHKYGFKNADVLVLSGNHCSNIEYAISYGEMLLRSEAINNILIIGINKVSEYAERVIGNYAVLGDGIGIVLLSSEAGSGVKINESFSLTNGAFYEADLVKAPPLILYKNYMMCISGLLKKSGTKPHAFSEIILQNANTSGIIECFKGLGFNLNKINKENITKYGHIDCIDFVINLKTILDKKAPPGTKIISFGNGYAGSNICLNLEVV